MSGNKKFFIFFSLALCMTTGVLCTVETQVTQPIGTLVRTWQPTGAIPFAVQPPAPPQQPFPLPNTPMEEVNYICAQWDDGVIPATAPFDTSYPTTEIILTQQQHFVRLLGTPASSSNGAWIMRSQYVRGKTPQELTDIFALKNTPIDIVNVEMPASPDPTTGKNYALWTGIAGPILGDDHNWGNGGSVQNRLIVDFGYPYPAKTNYFPTYRYTDSSTRNHRQPIGDYALSYRPMAGCGNTYCIASYLDTYIPVAYSDLENVYHALDYLNYIDYGPIPLQAALHQISPERYDAISFVAFRNALLFGESILEWQVNRQWKDRWFPCADTEERHHTKPSLWLQYVNEFNNNVPVHNCQPVNTCDDFYYHTNGLLCCLDWQACPHVAVGISAEGFNNSLAWCDGNGKAHNGTAQGGVYARYFPQHFFIDGLISGGGNWGSAHHHITFYGVARTAYSRPKSQNIEAHLQGGLSYWQWLIPTARISYFFIKQKCFNECGADSLNLAVNTYKTHTLHVNLGLEMNHVFENNHIKFVPQLQLAWAGDFFLRSHIIKAQITGPTGDLCVHGMHQPGGYFVCSAELNFIANNCNAIFARYEAQIRSGCAIHAFKVGLQAGF